MEKENYDTPPTYTDAVRHHWIDRRKRRKTFRLIAAAVLSYFAFYTYKIAGNTKKSLHTLSIEELRNDYATCAALRAAPIEPKGSRDYNQRWVNGTRPNLIRNAAIWTGEPAAGTSDEDAQLGKGYSWISADVFIDSGLIQKIAQNINLTDLPKDTQIFDAKGRQLTAGIVDMHSHAGLASVANLQDDVNELSSDITPFLRSLDALDPLHPEIEWIKSGGVTTTLLLPGSGNNMGGEAFVVKLAVGKKDGREEISQQDMLVDPDGNLRWMKMACGENPKGVYGKYGERGPFSRLGEAWEFRHAFEQARNYVTSQDEWCSAADAIGAENMVTYLPQELKWESLGAVLRGQVRVNTHCYTIPDLESFVRHTNEFKFRIYAFHHAHQTYLVPEILKKAWGGTPAVALFADNMYYKVEAYTASERAGAILYQHNITPTYVSDNPVLNSQHVVFEAAKAYGYGLPYHAALAGVTSAPAELLGLGERVGKIKEGFDADIVVWDSDPLSAGAAPIQVWIDGVPQFEDPIRLKKPVTHPIQPDTSLTKEFEMQTMKGNIIFKGISNVYLNEMTESFKSSDDVVVIVSNGAIDCVGICASELAAAQDAGTPIIDVKNGYVTPPFTAFGSSLGLIDIDAEPETHDGPPPGEGITRAVDGLLLGGKQLASAYQHGVTKAISAPSTGSINAKGVSVGFLTSAKNALENGAVWEDEIALHYILTLDVKGDKTPSVSSAIGALRSKLFDAVNELANNGTTPSGKTAYEENAYLRRVVQGTLPLVLSAHSADVITSIIRLKLEIEDAIQSLPISTSKLRVIIIGGAESHLVAQDLARADIAIVLAPLLPHAQTWDQRRGLTGAPLTKGTSINYLLDAGVLVGISVEEVWETRDLGLLAGVAFANGEGRLELQQALDLVSTNFDKMLGLDKSDKGARRENWAIWEGNPLEIGGRVRALPCGDSITVWI
jgi:imidazolonepropionase-like amidohydrolase